MTKCPHCGTEPLVTVDICYYCGAEFGDSGEDANGFNCSCVMCGKGAYYACCETCREMIEGDAEEVAMKCQSCGYDEEELVRCAKCGRSVCRDCCRELHEPDGVFCFECVPFESATVSIPEQNRNR